MSIGNSIGLLLRSTGNTIADSVVAAYQATTHQASEFTQGIKGVDTSKTVILKPVRRAAKKPAPAPAKPAPAKQPAKKGGKKCSSASATSCRSSTA